MLTAVLLVTLSYSARDLAAPPYCPDAYRRYLPLAPSIGATNVPTNASLWMVENVNVAEGAIELVDTTNGATVALELEVTPARRFALLRARPRAELERNRAYEMRSLGAFAGEELVWPFTTGDGRDDTAPAAPTIFGTQSGDGDCLGWGLYIYASGTDSGGLFIAESPDGAELIGFATVESSDALHIPAAAGTVVDFRLIVVDLAGNRSTPTDSTPIEVDEAPRGGCTCAVAGRRPWSLLSLGAGAVLLLCGLRRRR